MRISLVCAALLVAGSAVAKGSVSSVAAKGPDVQKVATTLTATVPPSAQQKLAQATAPVLDHVEARTTAPSLAEAARVQARSAFPGVTLASGDVDALAFLVLQSASTQIESDLSDITKQLDAANAQKKAVRAALAKQGVKEVSVARAEPARKQKTTLTNLKTNVAVVPPALPANASVEALKNRLAELEGISGMNQLVLQQAKDRQTAAMDALSNLAKTASPTASAVVQTLR